jgi:hypothetical protein
VNRFPQGMPEVDLILDQLRDRVLAGPSEPVERPMPVIPILPITQS